MKLRKVSNILLVFKGNKTIGRENKVKVLCK